MTKEECEFALKNLEDATTEIEDYRYYNEFWKEIGILKMLINEHFESSECRVESSLTRDKNLVSNLVSEIDKLEKALDKACKLLKKTGVVAYKENGKPIRLSAKQWKEYLLNETN